MSDSKKAVVFDLDDTLYKEIDYLKSAFKSISVKLSEEVGIHSDLVYKNMLSLYYNDKDVFNSILKTYGSSFSVKDLILLYRNHLPEIRLSEGVLDLLEFLKSRGVYLGLLTDGRSMQQRNKIKVLKLNRFFSEIIISEEFGSSKPDIKNYLYFMNKFSCDEFWYIGDNVKKDFISPNRLRWNTVRLMDNGVNIHKSKDGNIDQSYFAHYDVENLCEIRNIIFD
ncbi:HAD family hydrolase [Hyunsoonleella pacifica]|uniref:HAD family hydrolase n=1 Tax=Hyunsoonleella pacifica TaxID=1080224 RepID=A0A4Q9FTK5_9FLAO|nr:HAD-IA family hydrolase [Hyunsoonleella pacifica]TBN17622.1 HAD family hydrolase [Hyunsoonleella pacifica]GGD10360.1 hypothetical protein GCM10011368_10420 [Hyunsoonleella pacifica]